MVHFKILFWLPIVVFLLIVLTQIFFLNYYIKEYVSYSQFYNVQNELKDFKELNRKLDNILLVLFNSTTEIKSSIENKIKKILDSNFNNDNNVIVTAATVDQTHDNAASSVPPDNDDIRKVQTLDHLKLGGFFRKIYDNQNPVRGRSVCTDPEQKFLVLNITRDTRGIGARTIPFIHHILLAIYTNRILIWGDDAEWAMSDPLSCLKGQGGVNTTIMHGFRCFYKDISFCDFQADGISKSVNKDNPAAYVKHIEEVLKNKKYPRRVLLMKLKILKSRVLYCKSGHWPFMMQQFDYIYDSVMKEDRLRKFMNPDNIPMLLKRPLFAGAAVMYFLRLNDHMASEVSKGLAVSLPNWFEPSHAIGIIIRGSDKCKGHNLHGKAKHAPGEMDCSDDQLNEFFLRAEFLRKFHDENLDTLVVTSEDEKIIEFSKKYVQEYSHWKLVLNNVDVLQGTGSATAVGKMKDDVSNYDVVVSAMTSFHMQLRTRDLIFISKSSWGMAIALAHVHGAFTFAEERFHVNLYSHTGRLHKVLDGTF